MVNKKVKIALLILGCISLLWGVSMAANLTKSPMRLAGAGVSVKTAEFPGQPLDVPIATTPWLARVAVVATAVAAAAGATAVATQATAKLTHAVADLLNAADASVNALRQLLHDVTQLTHCLQNANGQAVEFANDLANYDADAVDETWANALDEVDDTIGYESMRLTRVWQPLGFQQARLLGQL